ncbi:RlpA-like double-psi beta-barrel-protein domain-containing protein-containing protein [Zychaea mexicana]|uniref:RlpA-like double-psi beta-barrel-protein domain-containing protein-containing protein n=1 Tax=Zychaea mexicana TaxID=64656 RepID=UPI0022FEFDCD|nr:RlpA-like double-psi beta-barrel-protein domain-containing protein-containing protein [Zychaea mexicana]KAI9493637.1 RlpA-like double-psi beta-barrel-protein domain-containing protein-containing protein [Zychaea mexicana]
MSELDPNFEHNPRASRLTSRSSYLGGGVEAPPAVNDSSSSSIPNSQAYHNLENEKDLPHLLPTTIWTRFVDRYRFGKLILVGAGMFGVIAVMLIVLGTLDVLRNRTYRSTLGISVGGTKYEGDSWGTVSAGHFDMGGKGDGTYYDPGVGILACGTSYTAQDMVLALNYIDYGEYANPNESPVCGACIKVTGPLGTAEATIQDKCPGCGQGSLDLSPAVFDQVGDFNEGRIPVSWEPC